MNKRLNARVIAAVFLLFGLVFVTIFTILFLQRTPTQITREQFDLIGRGTTRADLEHFLGPPRNELSNPAMVWAPQGDARVSVEIPPGKNHPQFLQNVHSREPSSELVWVSKSGLIAVTFDESGCLDEKYFSTVQERERPSVLSWLRSRPEQFRRGGSER